MRRRSFLQIALASVAQAALPEPALGTIAFVQKDGLWMRDLPVGKPLRLLAATDLTAPRISPSGRWISYFQNGAVLVIAASGGKPVAVGKAVRGPQTPGCQWLRDHDELWLDAGDSLNCFTPANRWLGPSRQIAHASLPALVDAGATEIVYGDAVTRARGGEPTRMGRLNRLVPGTTGAPHILFSKYRDRPIPCAWSASGEHLLFWLDPDFSASLMADGLDLYRITDTGGTPSAVDLTSLVYEDVRSLSPDGMRLAISAGAGRNTWYGKRIATLEIDSGEFHYVTTDGFSALAPTWSPDGQRVAYSAAPAPADARHVGGGEAARLLMAERRIWIAGQENRPFTTDLHYRDEKPLWSADGSHLLFGRIDATGDRTLWLTAVDNPSPEMVAGPLAIPGEQPGDAWFGYYGYIDWGAMFDWHRSV